MPLTLHPCTPSDLPHAVLVERKAYGPSPFSPILFPGPFPPNAFEGRVAELTAQLADDPTTRWLKVVDSDRSGEEAAQGIAYAKYNLYLESAPNDQGSRGFGDGCNVEACEMVFGGIAEVRRRVMAGMKCVCE